jgi:EAL and modified HD-GYP domain-containing signal transduction protein
MTFTNSGSLPVASFLPVVNSKQQLLAIHPDFAVKSTADVLELIQHLKSIDFFEALSSILILVPISDLDVLPVDLDERFPASKIVLCVPASILLSDQSHLKVKHFSAKGFSFLAEDTASMTPADWDGCRNISIDFHAGCPAFVKPVLLRLHSGQHLARNISSRCQLQEALDAGFKLFSGEYAFAAPQKNKSSDGSARTRLLKLLGLVSRDAESSELEILFKQDSNLSYMLFKLVSSAAFAQTVKVTSFGQAINLLGRRQLQRWLQLLLYARQDDIAGALNPLMLRAAFRASLMEAICQQRGGNRDEQDCAFMIGMFSLLDKLFDSPLESILRPLNLLDEVLDALINRGGVSGAQLGMVELADRPNTGELAIVLRGIEMDISSYYQCMTKAYTWVNQVCQDM